MTLSLGIDVGTSGIRTAVLDDNGTVLPMARADHLPQDPERIDARLWWQAVQDCVTRQVAALEPHGFSGEDISRIAVDGTSGTMVLTDAALNPVSRALMYNSNGFDTEAGRIAQVAPESHITQGSSSALGRAMCLLGEAETEASYLLHQADYLAACLTGRGGSSDHNNALKTGFDPEAERWPDWIGEVFDPALLPDVQPVGAELGPISGAVAGTLGLSKDAVVCAGTTDSIAAFLACAPATEGAAVTSLGTTLAIKLLSAVRIDEPEIGLYSHRLGASWLVGGASNAGGGVLLEHFTVEEMAKLSERIDPDTPSGLDYYPLSRPGERFPVNDPNLPPRLTPRPDEDHLFLQGMLEGMARIEAEAYRAMEARGAAYPAVVRTAGGGGKNHVWTQIRSQTLGVPVSFGAQTEAAIGAARVAQGLDA